MLALAVIIIDHAAKLAAAGLQPADYTHNPTPFDYDWVLLLPLVVVLYPSRLLAVLLGLWVGGSASNAIDTHVWPGGVPDFIEMGDRIMNPADFAILAGAVVLGVMIVGWPLVQLFLIARRRYPERSLTLPTSAPSTPDADTATAPVAATTTPALTELSGGT